MTKTLLTALFDRIPRRYSPDNVKEINNLLAEYEDALIEIEAINSFYEKAVPPYFDTIEEIKVSVKNSTSNKASKKGKDDYFDTASCTFKDSVQDLITMFDNGERIS
jgi:hypothetical protein